MGRNTVSGARSSARAAGLWVLMGAALIAQDATPRKLEFSRYVEMRDGIRLAVDVALPGGVAKAPALFEITRYGRSREDPVTGAPRQGLSRLDRYLRRHGYAIVKVDARGSGASFGTRPVEYGPEEVRDGFDLVTWVVAQPWCSGKVGAYGTSYSGTTAELLTAVGHPAVKAVVPGWSDFDLYQSPVRPYGLLASSFIKSWSDMVSWLDANDVERIGSSIRRVDADRSGALLKEALAGHRKNPDVFDAVRAAAFRDDAIAGGLTYDDCDPLRWKKAIEKSNAAMFIPVSWLDAGTAEGALQRFQHFKNPQKLLIMASSHGGGAHASPYRVGIARVAPDPPARDLWRMRREFFDHHLKGTQNGVAKWSAVRFYNLGEEAFHDSNVWPPKGTVRRPYYLEKDLALSSVLSTGGGRDVYVVDPAVTTGQTNRWMTQFGRPVLRLHDRGAMDARMLTYTTPPLESPLQIAGTPVVSIRLSTDRTDGMLLAYLEDVDPEGKSRYLTEGGLRLIHRKIGPHPRLPGARPSPSFRKKNAAPMTPGVPATITFRLWPIAARLAKGHRLRLALAGADADTFDLVPARGKTTLTVHREPSHPSRLDLPVVPDGLR